MRIDDEMQELIRPARNRRGRRLVAVAATMGVALVGCSSGDGSDGDGADGREVTLQMWDYWVDADPTSELIGDLVSQFEEEHPGIRIQRRAVPYAEYPNSITQAAIAGELPDLLISDVVDTPVWGNLGYLRDIAPEVDEWGQQDVYFEGRFESVLGSGGEIYGLPNGSNTLGLYYDADVFDELGLEPPTTWEELTDIADAIAATGTSAIIVAADPSLTGYQWLPWLWQAGGSVDDVAGEGGVRAVTIWKDLVDSGAMTPDVVGYGHDALREQFASGQVAMMINGPWNLGALSADDVTVNWDVVPLPCDVECGSQAGGENFSISSSSEYPEEAWEFLEWLQTPEIALEWAAWKNTIPHRTDLDVDVILEGEPRMAAFIEQGQYMRTPPREFANSWPQVQEAISEAIHGVLVGGQDPQEALDRAANEIAPLNE